MVPALGSDRAASPGQVQSTRILGGAIGPLSALGLISLVSNLLMLTGPLFMLQVYDRVLARA